MQERARTSDTADVADGAPQPDASTQEQLIAAGEGTLDMDGRPVEPEDITILEGIDEEDWKGPQGP